MEARRSGTKKRRLSGENAKGRHMARSPPSNTQLAAKERPQVAIVTPQPSKTLHGENAFAPTSLEGFTLPTREAVRDPALASTPLRPGEQPRGAKSPLTVSYSICEQISCCFTS